MGKSVRARMQQWCSMVAAVASLSTAGFLLQGCGGEGSPTPAPTPEPTPSPTPGPAPPSPPVPVLPIQGVSYNPLPCSKKDAEEHGLCKEVGTPRPALDFVQEGYHAMWGKDGRDDLGTLLRVGANAVRVDSAFGLESAKDHSAFLDRAQELGLHVMLGFHTQMLCPKFDCYDAWKRAATVGLEHGYTTQTGSAWHPAVTMLILQDNPDSLNFGGVAINDCGHEPQKQAQCRVKAVLSAMDGLLAAEKEKGVKSSVTITAAWSSEVRDSIDEKVKDGIGYYGFQDMVAGVADPSIASYSPRSSKNDFQQAFADRWVHSINCRENWAYVKEHVGDVYEAKGFPPHKWFIANFRATDMPSDKLTEDLKNMAAEGKKGGYFMGANIFQFQNDYTDPSEKLFGLFGLGDTALGQTADVCQEDITVHKGSCEKWAVYCLQALESGSEDPRAPSVAEAWDGHVDTLHGQCTELLSKASIKNTVNNTNLESKPASPEQSAVHVVV